MYDKLDYDTLILKEVFEGIGIEKNPPKDYPLYLHIKTQRFSEVIKILERDIDKYDLNAMSTDNSTHTVYTMVIRYQNYSTWDRIKENCIAIRSILEQTDEHINGRYAIII